MDQIATTTHLSALVNYFRRGQKSTSSRSNRSKSVSFAPTTTSIPPPQSPRFASTSTSTNTEPTTSTTTTTMSSPSTTTNPPEERQTTITQSPITPTSTEPLHTPPHPFTSSSLHLLTQGAEALVYRTTYLTPSTQIALKYRPKKPWRHPTLDARLTRARILAEARVLVKCRREGVSVPGVVGLDWEGGWLALEWVPGWTVRRCLDWSKSQRGGREDGQTGGKGGGEEEVKGLLERVGRAVGRLHASGVVHGDLTTSNVMLRPQTGGGEVEGLEGLEGEVVLIDFGLAQQSSADEDKAVDLYVLERAFGSTHPEVEGLFAVLLEAYGSSYKGGKIVLRRLEDVRMRGRKKSMLG